MRFGTRVFLLCFAPFAVLLTLTFWMFERVVQNTVRNQVRSSLSENQRAIGRVLESENIRNGRYLRIAGENAALKAGIQLLLSHAGNREARGTVEDQLNELCAQMGFDLLVISTPEGKPLAAAGRPGGPDTSGTAPVEIDDFVASGLFPFRGRLIEMFSVPVNVEDENIAQLSIGEYFNINEFSAPVALLRGTQVIASNVASASLPQIEQALGSCPEQSGACDLRILNASYLSLPVKSVVLGAGYSLRSFENLDSATRVIESFLQKTWLTLSACALFAALALSINASRQVAGPITSMSQKLKEAERTGVLPDFSGHNSTIREVRDLMETFHRAAAAVRQSNDALRSAYVEFTGSLASALDARDRYTAGHSQRVTDISCAIAAAMDCDTETMARLRVGALLHDIGKIGIADDVLQKPGRLSPGEFAIVKQHPRIGRRILEGVSGFAPFLDAVELHHENWDGTGYPHGQKGEDTPIEARIIHVADVYDALTTHRPYRRAMTHDQAVAILRASAGSQFDPRIVEAFLRIWRSQGGQDPAAIEQELVETI